MHASRIAVALFAVLATTPAHATLAEVAAALKATTSFTAEFTQVAQSGATEHGRVTLARPGRVRFQYDHAPILVVADGHALNLIDYKVAQVSSWPIRGTPLAVLLDPDLDLARFAHVTRETGDGTTIEAEDKRHPEYGITTVDFARDSAAPGGLRVAGWQIRDAQGNLTRVSLGTPHYNIPIDSALFRFRDPRPHRIPGRE